VIEKKSLVIICIQFSPQKNQNDNETYFFEIKFACVMNDTLKQVIKIRFISTLHREMVICDSDGVTGNHFVTVRQWSTIQYREHFQY
jgi:hypothetical protein